MTTEKRKLVIDRSRWARGGINGDPRLLNKDGCMCCLGFLALACGIPEDDIRDKGEPSETLVEYDEASDEFTERPGMLNRWPSALFEESQVPKYAEPHKTDSELCTNIMVANDEEELGVDRETALTDLFADGLGWELEFVDGEGAT